MRAWILLLATLLSGCADGGLEAVFGAARGGGVEAHDIRAATPAATPAQAFQSPHHVVVTVALDLADADGRAAAATLSERYGMELVANWPLATIDARCLVFAVAPQRFDDVLAELREDQTVTRAQPVLTHGLTVTPDDARSAAAAPEAAPSVAALQTNLTAINAPAAHRIATGRGVRVAVIDTGLDVSHPDLSAVLELSKDFVQDGRAATAERHGTAVAGLIGARGGLRGVAFEARLLSLRGCWQDDAAPRGACNTLSLARAINFAAAQGADIVNLSIAGPEDPLLADLLDAAADRGVVIVAAAGPPGAPAFPASHPRVIAARGPDSPPNLGDVPAPTDNVLSTAPGGRYDFFSGASVAAAQVSGVAALLREVRPELAAETVRAALAEAASEPDARTGQDKAGTLVDACLALARALGDARDAECRGGRDGLVE